MPTIIKKLIVLIALALASLIAINHQAQAQNWVCQGKTGCTTVGSVCPDGTIFAGCPTSNYRPIYVTRCDAGRTFSGSCTGTRLTLPWNNGNATGYTTAGATSEADGAANTATLAAADADSSTGGVQPHQAAAYCDGLTMHGYSDWYLPSIIEHFVLGTHSTALNDADGGATYWSSTEYGSGDGKRYFFHSATDINNKESLSYIRCMRKD